MGRLTAVARLGVFGGTFDPVNEAHLSVAEAARAALQLDLVLVVPAGDPWRKADRAVTPAKHRLAMVRAAFDGRPGYAVSDLEIRRAGPTHTVDTLETLRADGYGAIWFIVGSDALLDLPNWHEPQRLLRLVRFGVVARPDHRADRRCLNDLVAGLGAVVDWIEMEPSPLSSTAVRGRLARGERAADLVPAPVLTYIAAHRLYRIAGAAPTAADERRS